MDNLMGVWGAVEGREAHWWRSQWTLPAPGTTGLWSHPGSPQAREGDWGHPPAQSHTERKQQSKIKGLPASPLQGWKHSWEAPPHWTPREPATPYISIMLVFGAQWNHLTMDPKDHNGSLLGLGMKEESRVDPGGVLNCSLSPADPRPWVLHVWPILPVFLPTNGQGASAGAAWSCETSHSPDASHSPGDAIHFCERDKNIGTFQERAKIWADFSVKML